MAGFFTAAGRVYVFVPLSAKTGCYYYVIIVVCKHELHHTEVWVFRLCRYEPPIPVIQVCIACMCLRTLLQIIHSIRHPHIGALSLATYAEKFQIFLVVVFPPNVKEVEPGSRFYHDYHRPRLPSCGYMHALNGEPLQKQPILAGYACALDGDYFTKGLDTCFVIHAWQLFACQKMTPQFNLPA